MAIKEKVFVTGKDVCKVRLFKECGCYIVKVNNEVYKTTPNELFAVQVFNAI